MKNILKVASFLGLALTIVPSLLVFSGVINISSHYKLMAAGFLFWFGTAPFWMKSKSLEEGEKE